MNNRIDKLTTAQQYRDRAAAVVAAARASSRVSLHANANDDASFVDIASRFVTAVAIQSQLSVIYAVHIDNWFGSRWLGFCGKTHGIAGVRNKTLKKSLTVPPFHPHRVLAARGHRLREDGLYADAEDVTSLHPHIPSESNIYRRISSNILYAWYSGNTVTTRKGVVMMYQRRQDECKALYTMFNLDTLWKLDKHVGITRSEVETLLESEPCDRPT